jgi:protein SCO1/2
VARPAALARGPWVVLAVLMLVALVGCGSSSSDSDSGAPVTGISKSDDDGFNGILMDAPVGTPYAVPDVSLTGTDGKPFDLARQPRRTLTFFGYTNCPDICQIVMSTLASAMAKLSDAERDQLQVAFITTDPARDTVPVLRSYLDRFNPDFVGATGPLPQIVTLAKPLGIDILKGQKLASGGYEVDHTTNVIAVKAGKGDLVWTASTSPSDMASDLKKILKEDA